MTEWRQLTVWRPVEVLVQAPSVIDCVCGPQPLPVWQKGRSTCWAAVATSARASFGLSVDCNDPDGPEAAFAKAFWTGAACAPATIQQRQGLDWDAAVHDLACVLDAAELDHVYVASGSAKELADAFGRDRLVIECDPGHVVLLWSLCQRTDTGTTWVYALDPVDQSAGIYNRAPVAAFNRGYDIGKGST